MDKDLAAAKKEAQRIRCGRLRTLFLLTITRLSQNPGDLRPLTELSMQSANPEVGGDAASLLLDVFRQVQKVVASADPDIRALVSFTLWVSTKDDSYFRAAHEAAQSVHEPEMRGIFTQFFACAEEQPVTRQIVAHALACQLAKVERAQRWILNQDPTVRAFLLIHQSACRKDLDDMESTVAAIMGIEHPLARDVFMGMLASQMAGAGYGSVCRDSVVKEVNDPAEPAKVFLSIFACRGRERKE